MCAQHDMHVRVSDATSIRGGVDNDTVIFFRRHVERRVEERLKQWVCHPLRDEVMYKPTLFPLWRSHFYKMRCQG